MIADTEKFAVNKVRGVYAEGYPTASGFLVLKGSVISDHITDSFEIACRWYYALRQQLIADGVIRDRVFTVDYEFKSPTAAASVIIGRMASGNQHWNKTEM